jgi:hypothetical protein
MRQVCFGKDEHMLAEVSPLVAVVFILGAVGLVAALIVIGLRRRLELEIPPRTWAEPPPMTPTQRRIYLGLFFVGLTFWGVGLIGAIADINWMVVLGMSLWIGLILARMGFSLFRAVQFRRARRAQPRGG